MKKTLITCSILSAALLLMALPMQAATLNVPADPGCGTIQAAVNLAGDGDTIVVAAGPYAEAVGVNAKVGRTSLTIMGAGDTTIVDPPGNGPCFQVNVGGVTITDMKLTGAGGSGNTGAGVAIMAGPGNVTLKNLTIVQNTGFGFTVSQAGAVQNVTISDCTINGNNVGIRVATALLSLDGFTITDCNVDGNVFGLYLGAGSGPVKNVVIKDSTFNDYGDRGMYIQSLSEAVVSGVKVINTLGRQLGTDKPKGAISLDMGGRTVQNIVMRDMVVNGGWQQAPSYWLPYGINIAVGTLTGLTIERVTVTGNGTGISAGGNLVNSKINYCNIENNNYRGLSGSVLAVPLDATLNWWGTDDAATIATLISGNARYIEFLCEPYPTTKVSVNGMCCTPTPLGPRTGCDGIDNDCNGVIDEADEDITAPEIDCNAPATITKKDASKKHPLIITPTATDDCEGAVAADVSGLTLYKIKKHGEVKAAKCKHVSIVDDTIVITKAHKKGMFIEWTVTAKDSVGNMSTETCKTQIVKKPKKDKDNMVMTAAAEEDEEDAAEEAEEDAEELVDD